MTTATWTRSTQTDSPSGNSFSASPTSNGGRDKGPDLCPSHLGSALAQSVAIKFPNSPGTELAAAGTVRLENIMKR